MTTDKLLLSLIFFFISIQIFFSLNLILMCFFLTIIWVALNQPSRLKHIRVTSTRFDFQLVLNKKLGR